MSHRRWPALGDRERVERVERALSANERALWAAALGAMVGDLALTYYGIAVVGLGEANPVARAVLGQSGYAGLLVVKLLVLGVAAAGHAVLPRRFGYVVPVCLLGPWTVATGVNLVAILASVL